MFKALRQFFSHSAFRDDAHRAYVALVEQSRKAWFYREQGVPDTVDGRFDVVVLHMFLLIHRLRKETSPDAGEFIRAVCEAFFADMDRSLREMGSSDTGVGMRVKNMAAAFYGRLQAYEQSQMNEAALAEAIGRNIFRGGQADAKKLRALAAYALGNSAFLERQKLADIFGGAVSFLD